MSTLPRWGYMISDDPSPEELHARQVAVEALNRQGHVANTLLKEAQNDPFNAIGNALGKGIENSIPILIIGGVILLILILK